MPTLEFKGKPFVYAHHLSVPFRELVIDAAKSLPGPGGPSLDDNLIIHGDNLEALKALLPRYAGKVDVIYIDPPYNTGNEGWAYNDAVNSPLMRQWLGETVGRDDQERHDKWLSMMWPRLQLLKELLSPTGSIWVSIDDNEAAHLRNLMDEVFGDDAFVAQIAWQRRTSRENRAVFGVSHEHILLYTLCGPDSWKGVRNRLEPSEDRYSNIDDDPNGDWRSIPFSAQGFRKNQMYPITTPSGKVVSPPKGRCWAATEPVFQRLLAEDRVYFPRDGEGLPRIKQYRSEEKGLVPSTLWLAKEVGDNEDAKKEILEIFTDEAAFDTPKPRALLERVIQIGSQKDSLILDSFAGSATTADAVLCANKGDNGRRRFILVETEDYADSVTAERVRRVRRGVSAAKDARIREGLGGTFTFCTLGDSLDLDRFFDGETRPSWEQVARYVAFTATGETIAALPSEPPADWFVGEASGYRIHLLYKPDLAFMRSAHAAISANLADSIAKANSRGKPVLLYAAAAFVSQKELGRRGITFCQLPYAIHRLLGDGPPSQIAGGSAG